MNKLLLWDIDGTLIDVDHAGLRAFGRAMLDCFAIEPSYEGIPLSGRTDRFIMERLFQRYGIPMEDERLGLFFRTFGRYIPEELPKGNTEIHPGIPEILVETADRPDLTLALLTGNTEASARAKLDYFSLSGFFEFGAFGHERADRCELAVLALERANRRTGAEFTGEATFVIGDTEQDIICGKAIGARTLAVATGGRSRSELDVARPTTSFNDFSDTAAFFDAIGE